ncbi:MAG: hypothetical protein WB507_03720 [Solirubrobacterales bacterium]
MTEESLGRAVAMTALAPIAERLADQQQREEREAERRRGEQKAADREHADRENRIRSGVATSVDLDEVAREAAYELARVDANQVWTGLIASGAAGPPTHDLLEVHVKGKKTRLSLTELSRVPVWLAPNAGGWPDDIHGQPDDAWVKDVWVDGDGTVWAPCSPNPDVVSNLSMSLRGWEDIHGRIDESITPRLFVLPHNAGLRTKKSRFAGVPWILLVDGIIIDLKAGLFGGRDSRMGHIENRASLREAVEAILENARVNRTS